MIAFDLIGNTPLVLLESFSNKDVQIYAKLEQYNPGGSVKDRLGKHLIETAIRENIICAERRMGDTYVYSSISEIRMGVSDQSRGVHHWQSGNPLVWNSDRSRISACVFLCPCKL